MGASKLFHYVSIAQNLICHCLPPDTPVGWIWRNPGRFRLLNQSEHVGVFSVNPVEVGFSMEHCPVASVSQAIYVFHAFFFSCAFKASLKKSTWTEAPWIFEKSPTGVFPGKALCLLNTFTYFLFFSEEVQICKPSQILLLFLIGVKN